MAKRVVIIGGGITGACIARELSKFDNLDITLIEKEADVGMGVSKSNTAIIHAGYDDEKDKYPIRAELCSRGNYLWQTLVKELEIPCIWTGSLVIARDEPEIDVLEELLRRGIENNVRGLEIIDRERLIKMEPNITDNAVSALWAPTAGVISPYEAVFGLIENAVANGVKLRLDTEVTDIKIGIKNKVITTSGNFECDYIINAAGLYSDKISRMVGIDSFEIIPRKGQYFLFDKSWGKSSNHILFPVPTSVSKGILVSFTVEGHTLIGPDAQDVKSKEDTSTTRESLEEIYAGAQKIVKKIPPRNLCIRNFAGLRPEPTEGDFIISGYRDIEGFINVAGIRSPGLASAPAIAEKVIDILREMDLKLEKKKNFIPKRKAIVKFNDVPYWQKEELIKANPAYGRVICRCETVTEAEIIEAIKRGARTVDGVKFRTRAGMGRCQGGFCSFRVMEILSRELKISRDSVTKKGRSSKMVICGTKDLY